MDAFRTFCHRLIRARLYPGASECLRKVEADACLSTAQWQWRRNERLAAMLTYARECVPFYRDTLAALPSRIDASNAEAAVRAAPLLRRRDITANLSRLMSETGAQGKIYENATGGSTGTPIRFFQDQGYHDLGAALDTHVKSWSGVHPGDHTAAIWGADRDFAELSWKDRIEHWASGIRSLNAFRMNHTEIEEFYQSMKRWHPVYLIGYATALEVFAKYHLEMGGHGLRFKAIRSSAEMLMPQQRELLNRAFKSPVLNFYGSREINNIAAECPEYGRLHLISTFRYVEVVDHGGFRLPPGKVGLLAITDLGNHAMPFVRYVNEDVGSIDDEGCPCGRPSPVLKDLLGRSSDLIRTPAGEIIHGEFFTHLFYGQPDVEAFQVHQKFVDHIIVRVVARNGLRNGSWKEIVSRIQARMGSAVEVELELCDSIPVLPSGKYRFTISDL